MLVALPLAAVFAHVWVPPILHFVKLQADLIQGISAGIQLLLWAGAASVFVVRALSPRRRSKQSDAPEPFNADGPHASQDKVEAKDGSMVQVIKIGAGGSIEGDIVGRDKTTRYSDNDH